MRVEVGLQVSGYGVVALAVSANPTGDSERGARDLKEMFK